VVHNSTGCAYLNGFADCCQRKCLASRKNTEAAIQLQKLTAKSKGVNASCFYTHRPMVRQIRRPGRPRRSRQQGSPPAPAPASAPASSSVAVVVRVGHSLGNGIQDNEAEDVRPERKDDHADKCRDEQETDPTWCGFELRPITPARVKIGLSQLKIGLLFACIYPHLPAL
jgi:hypothetical protein